MNAQTRRSCYAFPKSEESRRFGTPRNCPAGILPKANDRNEPRTPDSGETLKWVSKRQSRSSLVAFSLVPLSPPPSLLLLLLSFFSSPRWTDQHIYERHFVPDEVGVYVCEQHRPVGLEVPGAFWNDVVGRGRFGPGAHRIRETEARAWLGSPPPLPPLISALANCSIILDSRWPIVRTRYQL